MTAVSDVLDEEFYEQITSHSARQFLVARWEEYRAIARAYYEKAEFYKRINFAAKTTHLVFAGLAVLAMMLVQIWLEKCTPTSDTVVAISNYVTFGFAAVFVIFEPKKKEMRNESAGDMYESLCEVLELLLRVSRHSSAATPPPQQADVENQLPPDGDDENNGHHVDIAHDQTTTAAATAAAAAEDWQVDPYMGKMVHFCLRRGRQLREKFDHLSIEQYRRASATASKHGHPHITAASLQQPSPGTPRFFRAPARQNIFSPPPPPAAAPLATDRRPSHVGRSTAATDTQGAGAVRSASASDH